MMLCLICEKTCALDETLCEEHRTEEYEDYADACRDEMEERLCKCATVGEGELCCECCEEKCEECGDDIAGSICGVMMCMDCYHPLEDKNKCENMVCSTCKATIDSGMCVCCDWSAREHEEEAKAEEDEIEQQRKEDAEEWDSDCSCDACCECRWKLEEEEENLYCKGGCGKKEIWDCSERGMCKDCELNGNIQELKEMYPW